MDERLRQVRAAVRAVQFGPQRGQQRLLIRGQPRGGLVQQRPGRGDLGGRAALVHQVVPASAVADPATGQRVQPAEQAAQPAVGPPAAVGPGALQVLGDEHALPFVGRDRFLRRAPLGREPVLFQSPEQGRVTLGRRDRPVRREHPRNPVRPVPPADAVHPQIEFGQPAGLDPVPVFEVGGQRVLP